MIPPLALLALVLLQPATGDGCGKAGEGRSQKIVGGHNAVVSKYPWYAALINRRVAALPDVGVSCGGTLISPRHVLTAAHCFASYPKKMWVDLYVAAFLLQDRCLTRSKNLVSVRQVTLHGWYSESLLKHDIALLTLAAPVIYTPACLPKSSMNLMGKATIIGFGSIQTKSPTSEYPCQLQDAQVNVFSRSQCLKTANRRLIWPLPNTICAGYKEGQVDSCNGDSGGPLLRPDNTEKYYVIGITSFGDGCARPNRPGVYTDVSKYSNWISKAMRNTSNSTKRTFFSQQNPSRPRSSLAGDDSSQAEFLESYITTEESVQ